MKRKINHLKRLLLPNNKINFFIVCIVILGVTFGAIFLNIIDLNDQNLVIQKIETFIDNINASNIDSLDVFENSAIMNFSYLMIVWILGMTFIGSMFGIILLFIKSFIFGFSLASFISVYSYKGLLLSILYLLFGQGLNIFLISIVSIYALMFTNKLYILIFKDKTYNVKKFFKNYLLILVISLIFSLVSSLSESFLFPSLVKLIVKLFI